MRLLFFEAVGMICFSYLLYSGIKLGFGRKWIGIDNSDIAIKASINKLDSIKHDLFIDNSNYNYLNLEKPRKMNDYKEKSEVFA